MTRRDGLAQPPEDDPEAVPAGHAGASARRRYLRLRDSDEARVRAAHPRLGGLILGLGGERQSTVNWRVGAVGEEMVGSMLDACASTSVRVLHDRRIPRTRRNIDHIVVTSTGVLVIDPKHYRGGPRLRVRGGFLSPRTETLVVAGRDRTNLVDGVLEQVETVLAALSRQPCPEVPVRGMLCFVKADWPMFGGSFTTRGVEVLWARKVLSYLKEKGRFTEAEVDQVHRTLATAFPSA